MQRRPWLLILAVALPLGMSDWIHQSQAGTGGGKQGTPLQTIAFSPDGKLVCAGTCESLLGREDGVLKVWNVASGAVQWTAKGSFMSVRFSPDGKLLASAGTTLKLWEASTGKVVRTLPAPFPRWKAVAFSPDGKWLACAGGKGSASSIEIWEVSSGKRRHQLKGHQQESNGVAFSPDGKVLASTGEDGALLDSFGSVKLWDVNSGKLLRAFKADGMHNAFGAAFSLDGKLLVVGDGVIKTWVWDVASGKVVKTMNAGARVVCFSPDGKMLAAAAITQDVVLWQQPEGRPLRTLPHSGFAMAVDFTPDGKLLGSVGYDGNVKLWEVESGKLVRSMKH